VVRRRRHGLPARRSCRESRIMMCESSATRTGVCSRVRCARCTYQGGGRQLISYSLVSCAAVRTIGQERFRWGRTKEVVRSAGGRDPGVFRGTPRRVIGREQRFDRRSAPPFTALYNALGGRFVAVLLSECSPGAELRDAMMVGCAPLQLAYGSIC